MMTVEIDEQAGVAIIRPGERLTAADFDSIGSIVDPYIEREGQLNGLIIATRRFPGWDSFGSLCTHLRFVREHHKKIGCVAFATDSVIGDLAEKVASHFVNAEIRKFSFAEIDEAKAWITVQSA